MRELTPKQQRFVDLKKINVSRFESKVDSSDGPDSCWTWMGAKDGDGYGRFHVGKSSNSAMLAHRVAYGLATGDDPEAVCHRCDNPSCCNPDHLFGGTRDINNKDMKEKRRHFLHIDPSRAVKGERLGHAKLSEAEVREIRAEYSAGGVTQRALADKFGVSQRTINKVVRRTGWTHV